jgi:hypothetical protein
MVSCAAVGDGSSGACSTAERASVAVDSRTNPGCCWYATQLSLSSPSVSGGSAIDAAHYSIGSSDSCTAFIQKLHSRAILCGLVTRVQALNYWMSKT